MQIRHRATAPTGKLSLNTTTRLLITSLLFASCAAAPKSEAPDSLDYLYKDLPFEMAHVCMPSIPSLEVSIKDFGGNGNGTADNTDAFVKAVDYLSSRGGGHLIVPEGIWFTGPFMLKSNIDLHVEPLAIVIFDPDTKRYPIVNTVFEGLDTRRCDAPIHADGAHDIAITGGGVIDGNGGSWRAVKKAKVNSGEWKALLASGGVLSEDGKQWFPSESYKQGFDASVMNVPPKDFTESQYEEIRDFLRPELVALRNCERVLLEDCVFQNSPSWNLHPLMCRDVIIKGVTVRNPYQAQNGDGIDLDSCDGSLIIDSSFDVGDDGICIKSGKDEDGRRRGIPCRNLIVDNCTVFHGHGGFVIGSEMSGGVENMMVRNCRFLGTDVGLRFKSARGRGGVVRNIHADNIYMTDIITEPVLFDLHYTGVSAVEAAAKGVKAENEAFEVNEGTPEFRDITISNIRCNGAGRAMYFNGLPEMPVKNVTITSCTITSRKGIEIHWAENVNIRGIDVTSSEGESVITDNVTNVTIK